MPTACRCCCCAAIPSSPGCRIPVLQQLEHYGNPALGLNDAFKSVSRHWDRITHPAQILQSLPAALATMLDPADCGPAFLGLPQDVQGWTFDYPVAFFDDRTHRIRRQPADARELAEAADLLRQAKRPVLIAGGGIQYSGRHRRTRRLRRSHRHPGGRNHRRPRQPARHPPFEHRSRRRHWFDLGQYRCRTGGRDPGRRHEATGFHHRKLDGLRRRRTVDRPERRPPRRRQTSGGDGGG